MIRKAILTVGLFSVLGTGAAMAATKGTHKVAKQTQTVAQAHEAAKAEGKPEGKPEKKHKKAKKAAEGAPATGESKPLPKEAPAKEAPAKEAPAK